MLEISLLGHLRSVTSGSGGAGRCLQLRPVAANLLAYLVLQREHPRPRDVIAATFWGELPTAEARRRLNTALWRLRQVIEPSGVPRGTYLLVEPSGAMSFNRGSDACVDVARFEAAITPILARSELCAEDAERLAEAVALYRGDLLEGAYESWVVQERERLGGLYIAALARLVAWHHAAGEPDAALRYAQRIIDRDPLREDVHRTMIQLYAGAGRRTEALRQYETCRRILADELGVDPLPETTAAAVSVAQGVAPGVAHGGPHREAHGTGGAPAPRADGAGHAERLLDQLLRAQGELRQLADVLQRAVDEVRALAGAAAPPAPAPAPGGGDRVVTRRR